MQTERTQQQHFDMLPECVKIELLRIYKKLDELDDRKKKLENDLLKVGNNNKGRSKAKRINIKINKINNEIIKIIPKTTDIEK